ncbi:MAG TPA: hypothetical protein VJ400_05985 [Thermoplasmata archaeon]|nr:hypothetical protein [Thermoplasmata archaeon]
MTGSYESGRPAISGTILAQKQPYEYLIILGGGLAIILAALAFAIKWLEGIPLSEMNTALRTFVLTLVLGGALVVSGAIARKNVMNGVILAVVVCVVLIVYGGQEGTIGGLVGLIGSGVAAASVYIPRGRH